MSSILKALKKLEEEKTVKQGRSPDLARAFLKEENTRGPSRRLFALSLVLVAIVAVVVTYAAMGGFGSKSPDTPPVTSAKPAPSAAAGPGGQDGSVSAPMAPQPVPVPDPVALPQGRQISAPSASVVVSAKKRDQAPSEPVFPASAPAIPTDAPLPYARGTAPSPPLPVTSKGSPAITLSGIAWQKDNSSRYAMLNGSAVGVGGVVEGARVEEILPDRVRLSLRGETFEITLGKE